MVLFLILQLVLFILSLALIRSSALLTLSRSRRRTKVHEGAAMQLEKAAPSQGTAPVGIFEIGQGRFALMLGSLKMSSSDITLTTGGLNLGTPSQEIAKGCEGGPTKWHIAETSRILAIGRQDEGREWSRRRRPCGMWNRQWR